MSHDLFAFDHARKSLIACLAEAFQPKLSIATVPGLRPNFRGQLVYSLSPLANPQVKEQSSMAERTYTTDEKELPNGDLQITTTSSLDVGPLHVGSSIESVEIIKAEDREDEDE